MTDVIVFSKDRAMQLDALLDSLKANLTGDPHPPQPFVLWTASNRDFRRGYERCFRDHPWAVPVVEHDFRDLYEALLPKDGYVLHFCDDDVLHHRANLQHMTFEMDKDERVLAFSLRLGTDTLRCYPHDCFQRLPESMRAFPSRLSWTWPGAELDFSYPCSLDGHMLRVSDLRVLLEGQTYSNPNGLEDVLARRAHLLVATRPRMASYPTAALTGVPANIVNDTHPNRCANLYDTAWLNQMYLAGSRIDWAAMGWDCVDAAHVVLPYIFTPPIADAA